MGTEDLAGQSNNVPSWNAGRCCGAARSANIDDVGFLRSAITTVLAAHSNIDSSRVYFSGHSNGCMMAQRMAYEASDLVAAVGCFAGYLSMTSSWQTTISTPSGYTPTSVMFIQGTSDSSVQWSGAFRNLGYSRQLNQCPGTT